MTLTPAYGRDYKSRKEAIADLVAGKDFELNTYNTSIRDLPNGDYQIRWKRLTMVAIVTIKEHKIV